MPSIIYAHMTWTTLNRAPLITPAVASFLDGFLPMQARRHGARIIAVGILRDHVHVLLHLNPACDIPDLARAFKGASSRLANRDGIANPQRPLRWARGYDLRSVAPSGVVTVEQYVRGQARRHPLDAVEHTTQAVEG